MGLFQFDGKVIGVGIIDKDMFDIIKIEMAEEGTEFTTDGIIERISFFQYSIDIDIFGHDVDGAIQFGIDFNIDYIFTIFINGGNHGFKDFL